MSNDGITGRDLAPNRVVENPPPARREVPLDHFIFRTVEEVSTPKAGTHQVMLGYWWSVDAQGRVGFYNPRKRSGHRAQRGDGNAQANKDERIARGLLAKGHPSWGVDVVQIPVAYERIDVTDY